MVVASKHVTKIHCLQLGSQTWTLSEAIPTLKAAPRHFVCSLEDQGRLLCLVLPQDVPLEVEEAFEAILEDLTAFGSNEGASVGASAPAMPVRYEGAASSRASTIRDFLPGIYTR